MPSTMLDPVPRRGRRTRSHPVSPIRQMVAPPVSVQFLLQETDSTPPMYLAAPVTGSDAMTRPLPPVVAGPTGSELRTHVPPSRFQIGMGRLLPPFVFPVIVIPASSIAHAAPFE